VGETWSCGFAGPRRCGLDAQGSRWLTMARQVLGSVYSVIAYPVWRKIDGIELNRILIQIAGW